MFMDEISAGLAVIGIGAIHIHTEPFGPAPSVTPGIASHALARAAPTSGPTGKDVVLEL